MNVWSHGVPGLCFLLLGALARLHVVPGGLPLLVFCCCTAATHLLSAITHVYPDDHFLEKLDHLGIVALIMGTPVTALMAMDPGGDRTIMVLASLALLVAAFLRPTLRTLSFVAVGAVMVATHLFLFNWIFSIEIVLYMAGAVFFLRGGGHKRWYWLTDHHLLHYAVTIASCLHVVYIQEAIAHPATGAHHLGSWRDLQPLIARIVNWGRSLA